MPTLKRKLDFELCKIQMLRLEAGLEDGDITKFSLDQFKPENIAYNAKKLFDAELILVKGPRKGEGGYTAYIPRELTDNGRKFLEAAKDEARWQKAVQTVEAQGGTEVLGPLVAALFAGA